MLEAENITKRFFGITAVDGVSISVKEGETVGIIGTNGAGKTTLFNILTGFERADSGSILYKGRNVTNLAPNRLVKMGFARTFQNLRLFYSMTVRENLLVSAIACKKDPKACDDLLRATNLFDKRNHLAAALPYGEMRKLEIARAAATGAKILFLDEPSAAMTHGEASELGNTIQKLKQAYGITAVIIEHNMELVRLSCDRVYAMAEGRVIFCGTPQDTLNDPQVKRTMLTTEKVC